MENLIENYKMKLKKLKQNRNGIFGLDSAKVFFSVLLGIALLSFVIIIIMGTLQDTNVTTNAQAANATQNVLGNVTGGIVDFFSNLSSVFVILAVVVIILVLVVLVRVVGGGGKGGSL